MENHTDSKLLRELFQSKSGTNWALFIEEKAFITDGTFIIA